MCQARIAGPAIFGPIGSPVMMRTCDGVGSEYTSNASAMFT